MSELRSAAGDTARALRVCRYSAAGQPPRVGVIAAGDTVAPAPEGASLLDVLRGLRAGGAPTPAGPSLPLVDVRLHVPAERQEVWGAGVTYARSRRARVADAQSSGAADVYERVFTAERPELFLKAVPGRAVAYDDEIAVRSDSRSTVPEPELALWLDADLALVGLGLANDMSARDIEGENPLYLPQAKIYDAACALGPWVLATGRYEDAASLPLRARIERDGATLFEGETTTAKIVRPLADLAAWLGRDTDFPDGVVLMTGTGIVPPDEVALRAGDVVTIAAPGLGEIRNRVRVGGSRRALAAAST